MTDITRRSALGMLGAGAVGVLAGGALTSASHGRAPGAGRTNPTQVENLARGSRNWLMGKQGSRAADDIQKQIKAYASATSVNVGQSIDFHVSANPAQDFTVDIYRFGYYGGEGARLVTTSPMVAGVPQSEPSLDPITGMVTCNWSPTWTLRVPANWASGLHLAVFTAMSGWRTFTPFVVRTDGRRAGLCVIVPFTTYQAYNNWPEDRLLGKSLYFGYDPTIAPGEITYKKRAFCVSFDRPYFNNGLPNRFEFDRYFVEWVEQQGYDLAYATSIDLHAGRVNPAHYRGLVFLGHDEYWSRQMRDVATGAVGQGTGLAFIAANNVYWHIRMTPSVGGRPDRVMVCYKTDPDPSPDANGPTTQWRLIDRRGSQAEQALLGVQFNGIPTKAVPLVVRSADHWFWAGTGVRDGDLLDAVVGGEADGFDRKFPGPVGVSRILLSESPYHEDDGDELIQHTSVYQTRHGTVVFASGSNDWSAALACDGRRDPRIQIATANVLNRMLQRG